MRESYEKRVKKLPKEFQRRIARFIKINPKFAEGTGSRPLIHYELFCCEQAVVVAKAANRFKNPIEAIDKWWDAGKRPRGWSREHSGNSAGASYNLARTYIQRPDLIVKTHGALCALIGCEDYGCWVAHRSIVE